MKCSNCNQDKPLKTAIKSGVYLKDMCERCIANFTTSAIYARRSEREWQKRHFYKDTIQRFNGDQINKDFLSAYPEQSLEQFGEEAMRGYSRKNKLL